MEGRRVCERHGLSGGSPALAASSRDETGIIERLYDVDWGVTEALVAEGITADAVARANDGAVSEDVLELIRSQYDALQFLAQAAREGRDVSISLIKELHVALTRRQPTYTATGPEAEKPGNRVLFGVAL